jgi:hypothetical protein
LHIKARLKMSESVFTYKITSRWTHKIKSRL